MKKIAFVFSHSPHGTTFGKEGLDAILGTSAILKEISLFFIGDGVLQLFKSYQSEKILTRDYVSLFSLLSLYAIKDFYCCKLSLCQKGLNCDAKFILPVNILNPYLLRSKLDSYDAIINF